MSRTANQQYKKRNDLCSKRNSFRQIAAVKWLRANAPQVILAIDAEAEKLWPLVRTGNGGQRVMNDYSFVSKLKVKP